MKKQTAIVLGYGSRGSIYAKYAVDRPDELEVVAVAEPIEKRQAVAKGQHNLSDDKIVADWEELTSQPKMADIAIICTQDKMHLAPALACIEKGYNILLEKPIAPTAKECKIITEAAEKKGVKVIICHVLRFTDFWSKLKNILDNGEIGEIMSIIHMENVGHLHQSHSFVRGNWRNSVESAPMILAKTCHDMDILQWLIGKDCKKIQSFGSLSFFNKENRPEGAPDYCMEGCPAADECVYHAKKVYYYDKDNWFKGVATNSVITPPTDEQTLAAIQPGKPYGRCVFACDNDVVDHQVVNMEFDGGCTVSFTMSAFNEGGRFIRIFGTKGEIVGDMEKDTISIFSFKTRKTTEYNLDKTDSSIVGGHGGGDTGIMRDTLAYFADGTMSKSICSLRTSYMNHIMSFAAEESRLKGTVIDLEEFSKEI